MDKNKCKVDVSIILVNYNTKEYTLNCIKSVIEHSQKTSFEIIVVDNASTDGSIEILREENNVVLIENSSNLGFGRANNEGARRASGKYLFFLNTDTLLLADAITDYSTFLDEHKDVGVCGGNMINGEKESTASFERVYPSISYLINELLLKIPFKIKYGRNTIYNNTNAPLEVAYVSGADLMIRKDLFELIGGFDRNFFMYFEEVDLCKRVRELNSNIICLPNVDILHYGGRSTADSKRVASDSKLKIITNSANYFLEKHYSKPYRSIYKSLYFLVVLSRVVEFSILNDQEKLRMWKTELRMIF